MASTKATRVKIFFENGEGENLELSGGLDIGWSDRTAAVMIDLQPVYARVPTMFAMHFDNVKHESPLLENLLRWQQETHRLLEKETDQLIAEALTGDMNAYTEGVPVGELTREQMIKAIEAISGPGIYDRNVMTDGELTLSLQLARHRAVGYCTPMSHDPAYWLTGYSPEQIEEQRRLWKQGGSHPVSIPPDQEAIPAQPGDVWCPLPELAEVEDVG